MRNKLFIGMHSRDIWVESWNVGYSIYTLGKTSNYTDFELPQLDNNKVFNKDFYL